MKLLNFIFTIKLIAQSNILYNNNSISLKRLTDQKSSQKAKMFDWTPVIVGPHSRLFQEDKPKDELNECLTGLVCFGWTHL